MVESKRLRLVGFWCWRCRYSFIYLLIYITSGTHHQKLGGGTGNFFSTLTFFRFSVAKIVLNLKVNTFDLLLLLWYGHESWLALLIITFCDKIPPYFAFCVFWNFLNFPRNMRAQRHFISLKRAIHQEVLFTSMVIKFMFTFKSGQFRQSGHSGQQDHLNGWWTDPLSANLL